MTLAPHASTSQSQFHRRYSCQIHAQATSASPHDRSRLENPSVRLVLASPLAGQQLPSRQVADGLAWHYTRYSDDARLAAAEREARAARRGLWRDPETVAPWEWRAGEAERKRQPAGAQR